MNIITMNQLTIVSVVAIWSVASMPIKIQRHEKCNYNSVAIPHAKV